MSISSETNRNDYTGNGATSAYSYTFRIVDEDDLLVTIKDTSDAESTLTITTDYTVSGVGSSSGGTVTLVNSAQAWLDGDGDLLSNYTITIRRVVDIVQSTDIRNQGDFYPETHEDAFDYLTFIDQQQQDELDRSVKNPESIPTSTFNPTLPTDIATANSALVTNSGGTGFDVGPTISEISNAQTYATNASASATLASQWASKTDGQVATTDYSSKAWAIGGTGVTDTASAGAAKEWATETSGTVDGTDYSSKEFAIGTQASTGGSAKDWAVYTAGDVRGGSTGDMSSKEWAVGTQGRGVSGEGSAKDWATYTSSTVDDTDYSSKEYAVGTQNRGLSGGGSSKDWAIYTGGTVDDTDYSAKYHATQAAASAASAAAALNSAFFRDVVYITDADSPVTLDSTANGKLYSMDSSGGTIAITLPQISGLTLPYNVSFSLGTAGNTVTISRAGTDTIEGATSTTLTVAGTGLQLAADDDGTPDNWTALSFGSVPDASITTAKIADDAVTDDKASFTAPTVQKFTSGSGTYTTPAGVKWIRVRMVGGGGGGGGAGTTPTNGSTGGDSTFGSSLLTASGGVLGGTGNSTGGAGGAASLGTGPVGLAIPGGYGGQGNGGLASAFTWGAIGGSSALGGAGYGGVSGAANGGAGQTNTGGGGGGASGGSGQTSAAGGGGGGYVDAIIYSPSATYAYAVGAGGSGGTGTNSGGAGGSGVIIVEEYYI